MDALDVAGILHALASTDRLRLVQEIVSDTGGRGDRGGGSTIAVLAERLEISRFSASRHLSILREAGVIVRTWDGVRSVHTLNRRTLEIVEDWLYPLVDAADSEERADIA